MKCNVGNRNIEMYCIVWWCPDTQLMPQSLIRGKKNCPMSWRVPQKEHERLSETGVFLPLDHVSRTFCLSHYVIEISHLYSLRDFWRHFGLCRAAAHSDCCFFAPWTNILTYLLTFFQIWCSSALENKWQNICNFQTGSDRQVTCKVNKR